MNARVAAVPLSHTPDPVEQPLENMLTEIRKGNAHNAYFYAIQGYTPDWDPHYFTSLYAALELCRTPLIAREASQMALIQALDYFRTETASID